MEQDCVIIDNGSGTMKVGFSGEDNPRSVFSTVVALQTRRSSHRKGPGKNTKSKFSQKINETKDSSNLKPLHHVGVLDAPEKVGSLLAVGEEATSITDANLVYPVERGYIRDWEAMEMLWDHVFTQELEVDPESVAVLMTDSPLNEKDSREKMAQLVLEKYASPGFYVASKPVLSIYSSGRTRGIVLESGAGVTSVVPIFEGYALTHAIKRVDFAGNDLTKLLAEKLKYKHPKLSMDIIQNIKEKVCHVSAKKDNSFDERSKEVSYELPDGQVIEIDNDCAYETPEVLFDSKSEFGGITKLLKESISLCEDSLKSDLYGSIVLAGGTSMLSGFSNRVEHEIIRQSEDSARVEVIPDSQRKYAAWIGGSMFASLETFPQLMVTKQEWDEVGANLWKCL